MALEKGTVKDDPSNRLYARIRKEDNVIREHFAKVEGRNRANEIRRLLEKAILSESEEK